MTETPDDIAELLSAIQSGQEGAKQRLFSLVYRELKQLAKNRVSEGNQWSMQTTTLVHETYLRMVKNDDASWSNRHHFFWAAARAMRDILVERARYDAASKRGGSHKRVEYHEDSISDSQSAPDLIELNDALAKLFSLHLRAGQIVELKYFAGLSREEIADMLNISPATVWREWCFARAWLANELNGDLE